MFVLMSVYRVQTSLASLCSACLASPPVHRPEYEHELQNPPLLGFFAGVILNLFAGLEWTVNKFAPGDLLAISITTDTYGE